MDSISPSNTPLSAVVNGPLFLDVVLGPAEQLPKPGQELWVDQCDFMAGGAANQARALNRLGFSVTLSSYIGQDLPGKLVRQLLVEEGISDALVEPIPKQSVTASISVGGDRAMITSGTEHAPVLTGPAPNLLMADLRALERNRSTVSRWREQGTLVLGDVGWDDSGKWDPKDLSPLDLVDIFVPNEDEARHYTRQTTVETAALALNKMVPHVVITRGKNGVSFTDGTGFPTVFSLPSYPASTVDPTGAGDVFSAVLAWGTLSGGSIRQAVSVATLAAGISTETLGGAGAPSITDLVRRFPRQEKSNFDWSLLEGIVP